MPPRHGATSILARSRTLPAGTFSWRPSPCASGATACPVSHWNRQRRGVWRAIIGVKRSVLFLARIRSIAWPQPDSGRDRIGRRRPRPSRCQRARPRCSGLLIHCCGQRRFRGRTPDKRWRKDGAAAPAISLHHTRWQVTAPAWKKPPRKQGSWQFPRHFPHPGSTPYRSRTCNLRLRRPTLYPIELRAQVSSHDTTRFLVPAATWQRAYPSRSDARTEPRPDRRRETVGGSEEMCTSRSTVPIGCFPGPC